MSFYYQNVLIDPSIGYQHGKKKGDKETVLIKCLQSYE